MLYRNNAIFCFITVALFGICLKSQSPVTKIILLYLGDHLHLQLTTNVERLKRVGHDGHVVTDEIRNRVAPILRATCFDFWFEKGYPAPSQQ